MNVHIAEESYTVPDTGKFAPGNPGRPKGILNKRADAGRKAAQALAEHAWEVVHDLLDIKDEPRVQLEAAKVVLAYAHGLPTQRVEVEARQVAAEFAAMAGVSAEELLANTVRFIEGKVN